jgi:hypothetical protein
MMRSFRHHVLAPGSPRTADGGDGYATVTLRLRRCMHGDVVVIDTHRHPDACAALAGPRPPRDEHWREKAVRVWLVRRYDDLDDPHAIAVLTAAGRPIGRVSGVSARRMAPAIDCALAALAGKRAFKGCTVDVYCTALVVAEWDPRDDDWPDPGIDGPTCLEVTLLVDDVDLGLTLAAPDIPVCV